MTQILELESHSLFQWTCLEVTYYAGGEAFHIHQQTLNVDLAAGTLKKPNNLDIEDLSIAT